MTNKPFSWQLGWHSHERKVHLKLDIIPSNSNWFFSENENNTPKTWLYTWTKCIANQPVVVDEKTNIFDILNKTNIMVMS